jgi:hypothetical protein
MPPSENCSLKFMSAAVAATGKVKRIEARNFNIVNLQLFDER